MSLVRDLMKARGSAGHNEDDGQAAGAATKPWSRRGWTRDQLRTHWPHLTLQQVRAPVRRVVCDATAAWAGWPLQAACLPQGQAPQRRTYAASGRVAVGARLGCKCHLDVAACRWS